jgi:hypothetical protein
MKDSGYHTYMVGKWHMGKPPDKIPAARGFERDFSLLDGGGNYWDMTNVIAASPRLAWCLLKMVATSPVCLMITTRRKPTLTR